MQDVYERAVQITGSQRIMGIVFAPGVEQGLVRDVDWRFLAPPVENLVDTGRVHREREETEIDLSVVDHDLKAFRALEEEETKTGETKSAETETSGEPEVEDTGIKLHHMIKEMMLEDKKDKESEN